MAASSAAAVCWESRLRGCGAAVSPGAGLAGRGAKILVEEHDLYLAAWEAALGDGERARTMQLLIGSGPISGAGMLLVNRLRGNVAARVRATAAEPFAGPWRRARVRVSDERSAPFREAPV